MSLCLQISGLEVSDFCQDVNSTILQMRNAHVLYSPISPIFLPSALALPLQCQDSCAQGGRGALRKEMKH